MKLTLTIDTENDAFREGNLGMQLGDILHDVATVIEQMAVTDKDFTQPLDMALFDRNGNTVGTAEHGGEE